MIGVSRYDVSECTGYIIRKLRENDMVVRYTHPNLIFISWAHWIPGYVRQEYKKQTGSIIDGYGNITDKDNNLQIENGKAMNADETLLNIPKSNITINKEKNKGKDKDYNSTKNYSPIGIYNSEILQKIQNKFTI
jgi:hypothetical protein